jgi:hypothetical protein
VPYAPPLGFATGRVAEVVVPSRDPEPKQKGQSA